MKQLSQNEIRRQRQVSRIYDSSRNKNGTLFFVTVNSNKVIDPTTHTYNDGSTEVSYQTTINGMRTLERALNSDSQYPKASIEDYSIEIGAKALRLHTHFTVLLQHNSATHGEYHLDRDQIESIFRDAWNISPDENIHVNIKSNPYSREMENNLRDYMNQYIGPNIERGTHLHIYEGPRYVTGSYPMSRDPIRERMW